LPNTHQHECIDILHCCNDLCHARMVLSVGRSFCVLCTKCTLHSNHRLTRVIFQHTKWLLPRSGHFLTTYTRIA
jgi:hypothetical protein